MIIEYSLTPDDVIAFTRYHREKLRRLQPPVQQGGVIISAIFVVGFCLLLVGDAIEAEAWQVILILGSCFAGFGLLYWAMQRAQTNVPEGRLRRMFQSREGEKALGQRRLTLERESMLLQIDGEEKRLAWEQVLDVGVTEEHAFVYLADGSVLIVPSRAFSNDYLYTEFLEKMREQKRTKVEQAPQE